MFVRNKHKHTPYPGPSQGQDHQHPCLPLPHPIPRGRGLQGSSTQEAVISRGNHSPSGTPPEGPPRALPEEVVLSPEMCPRWVAGSVCFFQCLQVDLSVGSDIKMALKWASTFSGFLKSLLISANTSWCVFLEVLFLLQFSILLPRLQSHVPVPVLTAPR